MELQIPGQNIQQDPERIFKPGVTLSVGQAGPVGQSGYSGYSGTVLNVGSGYSGYSGISGYSGSCPAGTNLHLAMFTDGTDRLIDSFVHQGTYTHGNTLFIDVADTAYAGIDIGTPTTSIIIERNALSEQPQDEWHIATTDNLRVQTSNFNISPPGDWDTNVLSIDTTAGQVSIDGTMMVTDSLRVGAGLDMSSTEPGTRTPGMLWYDGVNNILQMRNSINSAWVDIGHSGYSGIGTSGYSGYSGRSGYSGIGTSGYSGYSGRSGYSGIGTSGYSGYSGGIGTSGYSGYSGGTGISGYSGYSGTGISGYSGTGISGYSGYSGKNFIGTGTSGYIPRFSSATTLADSSLQSDPVSWVLHNSSLIIDNDATVSRNLVVGSNETETSLGDGTDRGFYFDAPVMGADSSNYFIKSRNRDVEGDPYNDIVVSGTGGYNNRGALVIQNAASIDYPRSAIYFDPSTVAAEFGGPISSEYGTGDLTGTIYFALDDGNRHVILSNSADNALKIDCVAVLPWNKSPIGITAAHTPTAPVDVGAFVIYGDGTNLWAKRTDGSTSKLTVTWT